MNDVEGQVKQILTKRIGMVPDEISADSRLDELGLDSLDFVELAIAAERTFNIEISDEVLREVKTVRDVVALIQRLVGGRRSS